ncbi:MAG: hypothetical protein WC613_05200 [Candidatus Aenigmatarchaeota archaeon]
MKTITIKVNGKKYRVKDCKGLSSVRGLMFDSLKDKDGALIHSNKIWTPFCLPLNLFFLDEKFRVISKQKSVPLTMNPKTWRTYSNEKAKYCLEIKAK